MKYNEKKEVDELIITLADGMTVTLTEKGVTYKNIKGRKESIERTIEHKDGLIMSEAIYKIFFS